MVAIIGIPNTYARNLVDEEHEIYIAQPLITEPAWTQTGAYLKSFLFDMPNAVSRPNPQVGFIFTPGFTWSVLDILELNVGFPLVLNPDETGDIELDEAKANPALEDVPTYDKHPDFDLPGLQLGLKANILGKKAEDRLIVAVGVMANLALFEKWSANFMPTKQQENHSNSYRYSPYLSIAYGQGRFSPQLQVGASFRQNEKTFHPEKYAANPNDPTAVTEHNYLDLFFNLALPFALPFEGTIPMIELNGVWNPGEEQAQIFITPAVSFLPGGSSAMIGFACMLPILDSSWREDEGFRFLVNFSYQLDMLGIAALDDEESSSVNPDETPPANW
jgi:hypothetical protein